MATHDELVRMLQTQFEAQFAQWRDATAAQLNQLQSNMQAQFDQRFAEATCARDDGDGRRAEREDHDVIDVKHFRLCKVFDGTPTGLK